ncbi:hypothetical protein D3C79_874200 [compost metagenome]
MQRIQIVIPRRSYFFAFFINEGVALRVRYDRQAFRKRSDERIDWFHFLASAAVNQTATVLALDNGQTVVLKSLGIIIPRFNRRPSFVVDISPQRPLFKLKRRRMEHFCPQLASVSLRQGVEWFQRSYGVVYTVQTRLCGDRNEQIIICADEILFLLGNSFIPTDPVPLPHFRTHQAAIHSFCQLIQLNP